MTTTTITTPARATHWDLDSWHVSTVIDGARYYIADRYPSLPARAVTAYGQIDRDTWLARCGHPGTDADKALEFFALIGLLEHVGAGVYRPLRVDPAAWVTGWANLADFDDTIHAACDAAGSPQLLTRFAL
jgi:hypothetical protein